jgi:hypothetical protein
MRDLETFCDEGEMTTIIFNACRANPKREPRQFSKYTVVFKQLNDNEHRVHVRFKGHVFCAVAVVDKYDV